MSRVCAGGRCPAPPIARVRIWRPHAESHLVCGEHLAQVQARTEWRPEVVEQWAGALLDPQPPVAAPSRPTTESSMNARPSIPRCAWPDCTSRAASTRRAFCQKCEGRIKKLEVDPKADVPHDLWRAGVAVSAEDRTVLAEAWERRGERTRAAAQERAQARSTPAPAPVAEAAAEQHVARETMPLADRVAQVLGAEVATGDLYTDLERTLDRVEELGHVVARHANQAQVYLGILDRYDPGRDFDDVDVALDRADADRRLLNQATAAGALLKANGLGLTEAIIRLQVERSAALGELDAERVAHAATRRALAAAQERLTEMVPRVGALLELLDGVCADAADSSGEAAEVFGYAASRVVRQLRRDLGFTAADAAAAR